MSKPVFPCDHLPQGSEAKLLGLYPQRQSGLWLQRVKIPFGRLTAAQWRALAAIARELTPTAPLHLTTRQDVELHDIAQADVPRVQHRLAQAGMTTLGAAGDTVRNITICPCAGLLASAVDVRPLVEAVARAVDGFAGLYSLPRKFKISISACGKACAQPFINDLAFVLSQKDGEWGARVIGAGSLGAKPATGIELFDWVPLAEAPLITMAGLSLFDRLGDRTNRATARLRHVRQRLGDDEFKRQLAQELDQVRSRAAAPVIELPPVSRRLGVKRRLTFTDGDVTCEQAIALADLIDGGCEAVIRNDHRIALAAADHAALEKALASRPQLAAAAQDQPCVVACPGNRWCSRGLVNTKEMAAAIRGELKHLDGDVRISISGCPNGCAQNAVAHIGLSGAIRTVDGQPVEVFNLALGGGVGRTDKLATPSAQKLTAQEVLAKLKALSPGDYR